MKFSFFTLTFLFSLNAVALTQVKVSFLEALAPVDTTSSERFQREYDLAIQTGKSLTKNELAKCGYELIEEKSFYDASDTLQALEKAKQSRENGAWLIVGPRRSNHYLLVVKGAEKTPTVSTMASSKDIFELPPLHLTIAQSNLAMARTLAQETKKATKGKTTYMTIVNEDCVTCLDFAESFDKAALPIGFKKLSTIKITGEQPNLADIEKNFKKQFPDIVLLPNYSKVSAYLIGAIQNWKASTFFIGGDGWGDNKFGFVHNSPQLGKASGMTVKGFPPTDRGLALFKLGKEILKEPSKAEAFPNSGSAQALLKSIEGMKDILCSEKPKTKEEFAKSFERTGKKFFSNPWGVSVFNLSSGEIIFNKTVR